MKVPERPKNPDQVQNMGYAQPQGSFPNNTQQTPVLNQPPQGTQNHPNFRQEQNQKQESPQPPFKPIHPKAAQ